MSICRNFGLALLAAIVCACIVAPAGARRKARTFRSPDRRLLARVHPSAHDDEDCVEIRTAAGRRLWIQSYASKDGEHGEGVEQAAWSPDSRFFVWTMSSSGGHGPWQHPTDYYASKSGKGGSLTKAIGHAITSSDFSFRAPDILTVKVFVNKDDLGGVKRTYRLGKLLKPRK